MSGTPDALASLSCSLFRPRYVLAASCIFGCDFFKSSLFIWYTVYATDLILSYFLSEVRPLGLADATAFSRLPYFAGHHRPDRPPRSCFSHGLPSIAPLSSTDDCTRLLGVSHRSWYQIVVNYHGDCCVGVLELGTSSVFARIQTENTAHVVSSSSTSTLRLFCIAHRYQVSGIR